jgi:hypothetical protein
MNSRSLVRVEECILLIRGQKVMIDADLAELYGMETRALVQAVKRNLERFPRDFMFQLENQELAVLKSQFVMSRLAHGGRRTNPYVFTEQGVAMLSSVLGSPRAIAFNIEIMRAFVHLREVLVDRNALTTKLNDLERKLCGHDKAIADILDAIRQLMSLPAQAKRRPIGFVTDEEGESSGKASRSGQRARARSAVAKGQS